MLPIGLIEFQEYPEKRGVDKDYVTLVGRLTLGASMVYSKTEYRAIGMKRSEFMVHCRNQIRKQLYQKHCHDLVVTVRNAREKALSGVSGINDFRVIDEAFNDILDMIKFKPETMEEKVGP